MPFKLDPRHGIVSRQYWKIIKPGGLSSFIGGGYVNWLAMDRYFHWCILTTTVDKQDWVVRFISEWLYLLAMWRILYQTRLESSCLLWFCKYTDHSRHSEDDGSKQSSPCLALLLVNRYNGGKFIPGALPAIFCGLVYLNSIYWKAIAMGIAFHSLEATDDVGRSFWHDYRLNLHHTKFLKDPHR